MSTVQLDHIVLHLPYADIQNPPEWLTSHFTISPGGRHGDGKTENKLIVFQDGTYIELIAFVSDDFRHGHWWGDKGYGIVDYALTLPGGADAYAAVEQRVAAAPAVPADLKPSPLKPGSRTKPDGETIEWRVAFPPAARRGAAPFWCFDVTPRAARVPAADPALTSHPCGAIGIASLLVFAPSGAGAAPLAALLDAIAPQDPAARVDDASWDLATPAKIAAQVPCQLSVMEARGAYETRALAQGRNLVARLALFTEGEPDATPNVFREVGGDEVRIGFFKA